MEIKQFENEGNDCMIYKTVILAPIGRKYAVIENRYEHGSWFEPELKSKQTLFENYKKAKQYYDITEGV